MSLKLEKIAAEREKARRKRDEWESAERNGTESTTNRKTAKFVKWYMPRA